MATLSYMYLSKLSHIFVKSQGQSAGSMAQRPDPIPSPQQYQPAKGQHPEGQGSKLALLAFPPGTRSSPAVGHCSTVSAQLRLSPQQIQSAASQHPDGHGGGGFVAASLTFCAICK